MCCEITGDGTTFGAPHEEAQIFPLFLIIGKECLEATCGQTTHGVDVAPYSAQVRDQYKFEKKKLVFFQVFTEAHSNCSGYSNLISKAKPFHVCYQPAADTISPLGKNDGMLV